MRKWAIIIGLPLLLLSGCGSDLEEEIPPEPVAEEAVKEADPLEEARMELFKEIGIEEDELGQNAPEDEFPVVLPTPPELPKTDADLSDLPLE